MNDAKRYMNNLKRAAIENPLLTAAIAVAAVTAVAKLMDANTQRTYADAHVKEINRRIAMTTNR